MNQGSIMSHFDEQPDVEPDVFERLKKEAQSHAQEARTANATVSEIYQLCTGATGEPGNWHGAEPVRQTLASKDAEIARLTNELRYIASADVASWDDPTEFRAWAQNRARAALTTQPKEQP